MASKSRKRPRLKPLSFDVKFLTRKGIRKENISLALDSTERKPSQSQLDSKDDLPSFDVQAEEKRPSLSSYERRKVVEDSNWSNIRQTLLDCGIQECSLPHEALCVVCQELAVARCSFCGPRQYFCYVCALKEHATRNYFHVMDLWKDEMFVPLYPQEILKLPNHGCTSIEIKEIKCIDEHGNHHQKRVAFCQCESPAITLLRLQLWPGTPDKPTTAFHLHLMEMTRKLFLHCKASLKELCETIELLKPSLQHKIMSSMYAVLNSGSFEEYRFYKYQIEHLNSLFPQLDSGTVCPLCPKESGTIIQSMDGCFGLSRRKRQGQSFGVPKYGTLMFADQDDVDNFVNAHSESAEDAKEECSNFHAGEIITALRSKGKNKLFDEKGVFGRVCRHDFPKGFHSIKHGERIGYSIYEMKRAEEEVRKSPNLKLIIMYDIACILSAHLQKNKPKNLVTNNDTTFAIPIFHSYGHKASCQVKFSPRRIEGMGLTDGEGTERLWSFLRDYSRITKEMAADKRVDVLTDGLLHYSSLLFQKFGTLLKMKILRTRDLYAKTNSDMSNILHGLPDEIDENVIEQWKKEEEETFQQSGTQKGVPMEWDEQYVDLLLTLKQLQSKVEYNEEEQDMSSVKKKLERTEKSVRTFERKHGVAIRWEVSDAAARNAQTRLLQKKRKELLVKLHRLACERLFVLEMKKKYSDGQAIAVKLSKQIDSIVKSMQKLLATLSFQSRNLDADEITFDDAKDPSSNIYECAHVIYSNSSIPESSKKMIINHYCVKKRCEEEQVMLQEEVKRLHLYIKDEIALLSQCIFSLNYEEYNDSDKGVNCILRTKRCVLTQELSKLESIFKDMPQLLIDAPVEGVATSDVPMLESELLDEDLLQASAFLDYSNDEDS